MTDIERAREIADALASRKDVNRWCAARDAALAALRAAPASDAGLLRHFREMQDMCARWLQPEPYKDRDGVVWPHGSHEALVNDMIWMLDGPEQRAAEQALSTPPDTEKARLKAQIAELREGLERAKALTKEGYRELILTIHRQRNWPLPWRKRAEAEAAYMFRLWEASVCEFSPIAPAMSFEDFVETAGYYEDSYAYEIAKRSWGAAVQAHSAVIAAARFVAKIGGDTNESWAREETRCDAVKELRLALAKIDTEQETG